MSGDVAENRVGGCSPYERPMRAVVLLDEGVDFLHEFLHTAKQTAADRALRNQGKPAFDLIELGGVSRRVVNLVSGPLRQPCAHL